MNAGKLTDIFANIVIICTIDIYYFFNREIMNYTHTTKLVLLD